MSSVRQVLVRNNSAKALAPWRPIELLDRLRRKVRQQRGALGSYASTFKILFFLREIARATAPRAPILLRDKLRRKKVR
jgi:hypothetical protein